MNEGFFRQVSRFDLIVGLFGVALSFALLLYALLDPQGMQLQVEKDSADNSTGWFEHLTWMVLLPGIALGLYAFVFYRTRFPHPAISLWLITWVLACTYFAGEEMSWGQWFFQWQTPESLVALNDQNETNLHNISPWLDQKPRALVELFIFLAGFLAPLLVRFKKLDFLYGADLVAQHKKWLIATPGLVPLAGLFVVVRLLVWVPHPELHKIVGNSELREFCVAVFLSAYLISYFVRLKNQPVD